MRIVELSAEAVLGTRRPELEQLWLDVWPGTSDRLYAILPRHARRDGFRFLAAEEDGRTIGFAYGYVGGEGERWHERVAGAMTEEQRLRWLAPGELEFIELGVHPSPPTTWDRRPAARRAARARRPADGGARDRG